MISKKNQLILGFLLTVAITVFVTLGVDSHIRNSDITNIRHNVVMEYRMPIVYIWLGGQMPARYKQRLEWVTFPWVLLGQKEWEQLGKQFHKYPLLPVHKADILRILYLQKYAGVYSDLDNILNYTCLMRILSRKRGFWMAGQPQVDWAPQASNLLLFVDTKQNSVIGKTLQAIKKKLETMSDDDLKDQSQIFHVAGPAMLNRVGVQKMNDVYRCQAHERDSLWVK